jgi:hypothetical protein
MQSPRPLPTLNTHTHTQTQMDTVHTHTNTHTHAFPPFQHTFKHRWTAAHGMAELLSHAAVWHTFTKKSQTLLLRLAYPCMYVFVHVCMLAIYVNYVHSHPFHEF